MRPFAFSFPFPPFFPLAYQECRRIVFTNAVSYYVGFSWDTITLQFSITKCTAGGQHAKDSIITPRVSGNKTGILA